MLATIPRKATVCLGTILVALAVTACGSETAAPGAGTPAAPAPPSPYLEAISPIVSYLGEIQVAAGDRLAAIDTAMSESTYVVPGTGGPGAGTEDLMKAFTDGSAVFAQHATTLEGHGGQIAEISPPKEARQYHKLLEEYVEMRMEAAQEAARHFERQDVLCCVTMFLGDWNQRSEKSDVTKGEINAEARTIGYPEVD